MPQNQPTNWEEGNRLKGWVVIGKKWKVSKTWCPLMVHFAARLGSQVAKCYTTLPFLARAKNPVAQSKGLANSDIPQHLLSHRGVDTSQ
eukprot:4766187-Amphidinium_carterae.1